MKKIYALMFGLALTSLDSKAQQAGNYILNGNFEQDYKQWVPWSGEGASVDYSLETANPISGTKSAKVTITTTGSQVWHAQLDNRLTLHKDVPMRLTFKAKASAPISINLEVAQNYAPFNAPLRTENVAINTTVQTYAYTFTPTFSDGNMKFNFLLGMVPQGTDIWFDDVEIRQVNGGWDGNILPNGDFNEYDFPAGTDNFPSYRRKKLSQSNNTPADGGWEGGFYFADDAASNMFFDIDQSGKLNGPNAAHISVASKGDPHFFNGAYTVFFHATEGSSYQCSFDVVASQPTNFNVAMNQQPFVEGVPDMFSQAVAAATAKQTIQVTTPALARTGMHQIFFAGLPVGGPYEIWIDNVKLIRAGGVDQTATAVAKGADFGKFTVYPNPSHGGNVLVDLSQLNGNQPATVDILDLKGQLVYRQALGREARPTLATGLGRGFYIMKVQQGQQVYTQKLLVQ